MTITTEDQPLAAPTRRGPIRRLYDWVLHWAETPFGMRALFVLSFAESSFFPIPPDVLLIALCIGDRQKALRFASWCSVASVLGGIAGYAIGALAWGALDDVFYRFVFSKESFDGMRAVYDRNGLLIVFAGAFTPIPYKLITISAGVFGINFPMFVLGSAIGRSARFFVVAWLLRRFGAPIRHFIEKRFELVTIAGTVLLVGGFVVAKWLFRSDAPAPQDPPKVEQPR